MNLILSFLGDSLIDDSQIPLNHFFQFKIIIIYNKNNFKLQNAVIRNLTNPIYFSLTVIALWAQVLTVLEQAQLAQK